MPTFSRPLLNMMEQAYRIRNWPHYFETSESRKIKGPLSWVAIPTKHDGRGYKRATDHKKAVSLLCAWWSLLQVAAKMPVHGLLADRDGPLDADDIACKTNLPAEIYRTAFPLLIDVKIGWLEQVPWNANLDFAGNLAALITSQHLPADTLTFQRTPADASGRQRTSLKTPFPAEPSGRQHITADDSGQQRGSAATSNGADEPAGSSVQDRTGHNRTIPPTVPQGDEGESELVGIVEAKRLICKKILGGKNPDRLWSPDAENRFSLMVEAGLPRQEIEDIAWFNTLPPNEEIPELKPRRQMTETTLILYWGDHLDRAVGYRKKTQGLNGVPKKKEPPRWREFFRARYPEMETLNLPERFDRLDSDLREQWEKEHEDWEITNPLLPLA